MVCNAAGGAGGGTTYEALKGADSVWEKVRNSKVSPVLLASRILIQLRIIVSE